MEDLYKDPWFIAELCMRNVDVLDGMPLELSIRRDQQTLFCKFSVGLKFVAWFLKRTDS